MKTIIISDLHLGDRHTRVADVTAFLSGLPPDVDLVLNGDIMDRNRQRLQADHQRVLDLLRAQSAIRSVVWVRGNHDDAFTLADPAGIVFTKRHSVGQRLLIMHGHDFENIMPVTRPLLLLLCALHGLRVALGAEAVHVAHYAKRFPALYRVLRRSVTLNAIAFARAHGFAAVTCGHTHFVEQVAIDGITYMNTGAWTEPVVACVEITPTAISLVHLPPGPQVMATRVRAKAIGVAAALQ